MLVKVALRNLLRNPRRSLVTALTVAVGTSALFIFQGFNTGIMNQYRDNTVHGKYGHGQINTRGYLDSAFEKPWEHWIDESDALLAQVRGLPGVTHVFPRLEFFSLLTNGRVTVSGRGVGIDGPQEAEFFHTINIVEGKTLTDEVDGIVLGKGLARALDAKIGDQITVLGNTIDGTINGIDLRVVGIFHLGLRDVDDVYFRLPLKQAQTLLDTTKIESLALGLSSYGGWDAVARAVEAKFPTLAATPFQVLDKVYYQHAVDWLGQQFAVIKLIILVVVLLGIFNTASSSILERTQEIGNLRANGESVREILIMLAWEGIGVGCVGAVVGIGFSVLLDATLLRHGILMPPAPGITRQYDVMLELQAGTAVASFLMGVATAAVGTVLAGVKVARLAIAQALRTA